jgi:hypothetical protein
VAPHFASDLLESACSGYTAEEPTWPATYEGELGESENPLPTAETARHSAASAGITRMVFSSLRDPVREQILYEAWDGVFVVSAKKYSSLEAYDQPIGKNFRPFLTYPELYSPSLTAAQYSRAILDALAAGSVTCPGITLPRNYYGLSEDTNPAIRKNTDEWSAPIRQFAATLGLPLTGPWYALGSETLFLEGSTEVSSWRPGSGLVVLVHADALEYPVYAAGYCTESN